MAAKNLAIDPEVLAEALRIGGHRTTTATVNEALEEYVRRRKQRKILELFGTLEYDEDYDYKAERSREGSRE
jgi:Arc/MetJ family transcription regulator